MRAHEPSDRAARRLPRLMKYSYKSLPT